jgi:hypothetical protein
MEQEIEKAQLKRSPANAALSSSQMLFNIEKEQERLFQIDPNLNEFWKQKARISQRPSTSNVPS